MIKQPIQTLVLGLFALPLSVASAATPQDYRITDFGAVGDGQTLNTKAIQSAIDHCKSAGGGVVIVPEGVFRSGAIFLKPDVNLRIEKNAVLKGSDDLDDYPIVPTRFEGTETNWVAALVNADRCDRFQLNGEGTIDGSGERWWKLFWDLREKKDPDLAWNTRRPRLVCISNSKDARVSGLHLQNQAFWCLHLLYCTNAVVDGVTIRAPAPAPSSDGIDVDSCDGVRITRCDIDVNDDCISIKSGRDADGRRVNRPSENILVEKTRFGYGHGGVAIGSETSGGVRKVEVRDCVAEGDNWAPIRFKTTPSRGGVVENIVFQNMTLRNVRRAFEVNMSWSTSATASGADAPTPPLFRNFTFRNVHGSAESGGIITGLKDSPVTDIKFVDCEINAQKGLSIKRAKNVDSSGLKLVVKEGKAVTVSEVE